MEFKNKLICGDNLEILATMDKESVDLIYIDPPFFSNRNYEIIWGDEAEIRSFEDRWEGGMNVYIDWMKQRIMELHRVLEPTGSFYLHCDWHAGHYLKVMCDEIFGQNNFKNEIIWHYNTGGKGKNTFLRKHDNIFWYTKSKNYQFNVDSIAIPRKVGTAHLRNGIDENGREYYEDFSPRKSGKQYRWYLDEGLTPMDVWTDIQAINPAARERLGYPTQKPEALLERIIKTSSSKSDIVLDAFCGCGTALAVAQQLGRHWIGIDISPSAIALIKNRLADIGVSKKDIDIIGMPQKDEDLKKFKPYEFQYWIINEMHAAPSPRKSGDMGIDGFSFMEHHPIQVKQSEGVGRNVIDNFETAIKRYYKTQTKEMKGYVVAFSFGKGAYEEVARVKKEGLEIKLVTVQDILDRKFSVSKGNLF